MGEQRHTLLPFSRSHLLLILVLTSYTGLKGHINQVGPLIDGMDWDPCQSQRVQPESRVTATIVTDEGLYSMPTCA